MPERDDGWYPGQLAEWPAAAPPEDSYPAASAQPVPTAHEVAAARTRAPYAQAYAEAQDRPTIIRTLARGAAAYPEDLARRAIQNSQFSLDTGTYDAAVPVEASLAAVTGGMPFAESGAVGMAGGRLAKGEKNTGFAPGAAFEVTAPAIKKAPEAPTAELAAPYVNNPIRMANPGVYKRPDVIAREAAELVQPEHPALKELFGVTRQDLYDISQQGKRQGNMEPKLWMPGKATTPNEASAAVMTPANAQRIVDTLAEAKKHPELTKGMVPWYVMDPLYQQMERLVGPERARAEYVKFNSTTAPFSAGSDVLTEINRGTAANMYATRGDLETFKKFGNVAQPKRGADFPDDLRDVKGHMMHGVQIDPVIKYMKTGEHGYNKNTVKIPLYMGASGVPQTGFQTRWAVPDTHFASALGMSEVRPGKGFRTFMSGPEYRPVGPWFREQVADKVGVEAVPAQALTWGTFAPQTGVRTGIGAGKLELLSQRMWERAQKLGIDPKVLRDQVLRGEQHSELEPRDRMGGLAAQDRYVS